MNSQQPIRSQQVAATDDKYSIAIAIDIDKKYDDSKDDINENNDSYASDHIYICIYSTCM